MKYNDQPNTSFPENKLRFVPDEPPCVSALAASPSKQPLRNSPVKSDKQPRSKFSVLSYFLIAAQSTFRKLSTLEDCFKSVNCSLRRYIHVGVTSCHVCWR